MIRIATSQDLLDSFRPLDRKEPFDLPEDLKFPLLVRGYHAWTEPSGARTFLVFEEPGARFPLGIVFRRDQSAGVGPRMCEWCHSVRSGSEVGLLTASASATRRVGLNLCRGLECREKILRPPGADDVPELVSPAERMRRVLLRMSKFARQNLF
jgi:hypothetical protein